MNAAYACPTHLLEHLGFEVDRNGAVTVHVKRPGRMFGLTLEQALRRIDEFREPDSARILRALPDFYDVPGCGDVCRACGFRHSEIKHNEIKVSE